MGKWDKFRAKLMSGHSDQNIDFGELCGFLRRIEFEERIEGDHHIFARDGVDEILNLQPQQDGMAKAYQVRQVRTLMKKYGL